jgi:DNA-binding MarR family transcriptional regulator
MNDSELVTRALGYYEEVNHLMMEYQADKWLSVDLTISQLKSVVYIHSKGRTNFRQLAKALGVTPSVVTGIIDRLIVHDMVERVGNPNDRRMQWLVLTEKGETLLDNIRQTSLADVSQILHELKEKDLEALVQGLDSLLRVAQPYLSSKSKV